MGHDRRADGAGRGDGVRTLAEAHHHTPDDVLGYLIEAERIVGNAPLSDEERVAALPVVLSLLASKQVLYEQPQASPLMLDGLHNLR